MKKSILNFTTEKKNFREAEISRDVEIAAYDKDCGSHGIEIISTIWTEKRRRTDIISIPKAEAIKLQELIKNITF